MIVVDTAVIPKFYDNLVEVDEYKRMGQFILTGSHQLILLHQAITQCVGGY